MIEEAVASAAIASAEIPPLIVTPLTEPPEGASRRQFDRHERTCDCCGKYCPYPKENFYTGVLQRHTRDGLLVIIGIGTCEEHKLDG